MFLLNFYLNTKNVTVTSFYIILLQSFFLVGYFLFPEMGESACGCIDLVIFSLHFPLSWWDDRGVTFLILGSKFSFARIKPSSNTGGRWEWSRLETTLMEERKWISWESKWWSQWFDRVDAYKEKAVDPQDDEAGPVSTRKRWSNANQRPTYQVWRSEIFASCS